MTSIRYDDGYICIGPSAVGVTNPSPPLDSLPAPLTSLLRPIPCSTPLPVRRSFPAISLRASTPRSKALSASFDRPTHEEEDRPFFVFPTRPIRPAPRGGRSGAHTSRATRLQLRLLLLLPYRPPQLEDLHLHPLDLLAHGVRPIRIIRQYARPVINRRQLPLHRHFERAEMGRLGVVGRPVGGDWGARRSG